MKKNIYNIIRSIYFKYIDLLSLVYVLRLKLKGIQCGQNLVFRGFPKIVKYPNSVIKIGNKCKLNSTLLSNGIGNNHSVILRTIDENAIINIKENVGLSGSSILAKKEILIESNVLIGANCFITDTDHHPLNPQKRLEKDSKTIKVAKVHIMENVFIGASCIILKGVTIGENSVIGAGSVVIEDIPANCIARGNPSKIIKEY